MQSFPCNISTFGRFFRGTKYVFCSSNVYCFVTCKGFKIQLIRYGHYTLICLNDNTAQGSVKSRGFSPGTPVSSQRGINVTCNMLVTIVK